MVRGMWIYRWGCISRCLDGVVAVQVDAANGAPAAVARSASSAATVTPHSPRRPRIKPSVAIHRKADVAQALDCPGVAASSPSTDPLPDPAQHASGMGIGYSPVTDVGGLHRHRCAGALGQDKAFTASDSGQHKAK